MGLLHKAASARSGEGRPPGLLKKSLDAAEKSVRQATRTYQAALARFQVDLRQAHRSMGNLDRNGKQQFADLAIHFRDFQADIIHRCLKRSGMVALRVIGGLCPTCNHYTPPRNPPIAIY